MTTGPRSHRLLSGFLPWLVRSAAPFSPRHQTGGWDLLPQNSEPGGKSLMASDHIAHLHQQKRNSPVQGPVTLSVVHGDPHSMQPPPLPQVQNESEAKISFYWAWNGRFWVSFCGSHDLAVTCSVPPTPSDRGRDHTLICPCHLPCPTQGLAHARM